MGKQEKQIMHANSVIILNEIKEEVVHLLRNIDRDGCPWEKNKNE